MNIELLMEILGGMTDADILVVLKYFECLNQKTPDENLALIRVFERQMQNLQRARPVCTRVPTSI